MKVKEIGKWLLTILIGISALDAKSPVFIDILDVNGKKTEKIQLGLPFFIDVEVVSDEHTSNPKLETDSAIVTKLQGSRSSVYSVNGTRRVTKNYRYAAQANQEGVFSVGPAMVVVGGNEEQSEIKNITVQINANGRDSVDHQTEAYVEISTDSSTAYRGQELVFYLRLYMQGDDVHIEGIQEPTFAQCTAGPLEGPVSGEETINGIVYKYLEWKSKFYAHEAGTLVIPAIAANVTVQSDRSRGVGHSLDFLGMVGSILGTRLEHKQLFSNTLKLEILDLPAYSKKVDALGVFSSFTAKSNLDTAQEGEGVVFTLELVGQGNFSMIQHPALNLPEGLQYYDSNTAINQLGAGICKKDFEYIIQGVKPGTYTIPSQECTYFDKNKGIYKTLTTKATQLVIIAAKNEASIKDNSSIVQDTASNASVSVLNEIGSIEENSWQDSASKSLSFKNFLLLLGIILLAVFGFFIKRLFDAYLESSAPYRFYTMAFSDARKKLTHIEKYNEPQKLYGLWIELFALRLKLPTNVITQDRIQLALKNLHFEQSLLDEWNKFFTAIIAISYSNDAPVLHKDLYQQTAEWLDRLEGKL
jgi:hypothetical protein